jgi:TPR repeat protein
MNVLQKLKFKRLQKRLYKLYKLYELEGSDIRTKALLQAFYAMAEFYEKHRFDKNLPYSEFHALECYRVIASFGDSKAQYKLAERLLDYGKFWEGIASNPLYKTNKPKAYAQSFFEESSVYLRAADEQGYPLARRLLGMAHIHGWGDNPNLEKGYQLVLESIDLEQAWGKATQIFDTLKLNSPEFFSALRDYKG